jgi:ATP-dependent protease HslVU (ClpYQ) peptidase subunit
MVSGMVIINNATAGNKTYYYIAGRTQVINPSQNLLAFGGGDWNEDNIAAFRI